MSAALAGLRRAEPTPGFEAKALEVARALWTDTGALERYGIIDCGGLVPDLVEVPAAPLDERMRRDVNMDLFRMLVASRKAIGAAVMAEMWILTTVPGQNPPPAGASLENHPGRREGVMVLLEDRRVDGGAVRHWVAYIRREGGVASLDPFELTSDGMTFRGGMTCLLPRLPAVSALRVGSWRRGGA